MKWNPYVYKCQSNQMPMYIKGRVNEMRMYINCKESHFVWFTI